MASRIENILTAILNDGTYTDEPQSRIEAILLAILNETAYTAEAQSRIEAILLCILNGTDLGIVPQSRVETILECIYRGEAYTGDTQSRIEELLKQISEKEPTPPTPSTFTATFIRADGDGGGTLYTQTDIPAGTVPVYGGETPTTTKGSAADYPFKGWTPALAPITEDTTYTAVFGGVEVVEIADSWDQIIASIDDGSYVAKYNIGNYKPLDLGTEGVINMQIVAMDADELASGGYAPLTFVGVELLKTTHVLNANNQSVGGWRDSDLRAYLTNAIIPLVPANVASRLQTINKTQRLYQDGALIQDGQTTADKLWIPSIHEIAPAMPGYETIEPTYGSIYSSKTVRAKKIVGTSAGANWWTRTAWNSNIKFGRYNDSGVPGSGDPYSSYGIALGFCLGCSEG